MKNNWSESVKKRRVYVQPVLLMSEIQIEEGIVTSSQRSVSGGNDEQPFTPTVVEWVESDEEITHGIEF